MTEPVKLKKVFDRLPFSDRPDVAEIYADGLGQTTFNGRSAHLTFTVNRPDQPRPPQPQGGACVPAARLVLDAETVVDLYNDLSRMIIELEQQGFVRLQDGQAQRPSH
jgi:hypothetical protein